MIQPTDSSHIDVHLIEKALALTGKTMEDMNETYISKDEIDFSIEKFGWYLLSPEFIEKYKSIVPSWYYTTCYLMIGEAIFEYQSGNEQPLISLLEKI